MPCGIILGIDTIIGANHSVLWPGGRFMPTPNPEVLKPFTTIVANTKITHMPFQSPNNAFATRHQTTKYWRINVSKEVPEYEEKKGYIVYHLDNYVSVVEVDNTKGALDQLMKMTKQYLGRDEVKAMINACT